ncbi:MBL fold metallo-hydrolase [Pararhodobacter zhoushanensis]|uniref:MBL fold metallo-hydrolase n=1 Tax=Pararhodobacter zhoushanensis TaxID=2479545 RepID=A0ABT3H1H3_9RHOB|nr:MBL fold metallo-hydrolase [Pararhodobacter zhoushanensis]MCW1933637.1 MBL fold metallo-hydrolase [Pararhodobacter zhoushanensis]
MTRIATRIIGDATVTILTDGGTEFGAEMFPSTPEAHITTLLATHDATKAATNFNAVLIRNGGRTVLCDAGPRNLFGPTCGFLPQAMAEAGVGAAEIDTLFATHLHPDHIAGMITPEGAAVFGQAELVVTRDEVDFWSDEALTDSLPEPLPGWAGLARAVLAAYGDRLRIIEANGAIAPGLTAMALPGHTPGHGGWRLSSGAGHLIHGGDIIHAPELQAADPDIAIVFDIDADTARATRKRLLDELATDGALFTGGHFLHPAFHVAVRDGAGYRLERP